MTTLVAIVLMAQAGPVQLFDGKSLKGWHEDVPANDGLNDPKPAFVVRDGMLVSLGEPRGHLISDAQYENYKLTVEYRFSKQAGNCGVLVHASIPRFRNNMLPRCLEVQMPYLGPVKGYYTDWTPIEGRPGLFPEDVDTSDPWQFRNVLVRA